MATKQKKPIYVQIIKKVDERTETLIEFDVSHNQQHIAKGLGVSIEDFIDTQIKFMLLETLGISKEDYYEYFYHTQQVEKGE